MEQEIGCPRCYDIMTLSSNFDRLGYICQECDLFVNYEVTGTSGLLGLITLLIVYD
jgi:hypothetical protein